MTVAPDDASNWTTVVLVVEATGAGSPNVAVVSGCTTVVEVDCAAGSGSPAVVTTTIDGAPSAVGVSVTPVRTLATAVAATAIATRVATDHAATRLMVLLMYIVCARFVRTELTQG